MNQMPQFSEDQDLIALDQQPLVSEATPAKPTAPRRPSIVRDYLSTGLWVGTLFLFFSCFNFQNFKIPTQSMESTLLIGDHLTVNKFIFRKDSSGLWPVREPKRGDVVVFKWPGDVRQVWVKRLIGAPGDSWLLDDDGIVLNGKRLEENYAYYRDRTGASSVRDPDLDYRPADYFQLKSGLPHASYRMHESLTLSEVLDKTEAMLKENFAGTDPRYYRRLVERLRSGDGRTIPPGFFLMMGDNRNQSFDSRGWGLVPRELLAGRAYWVWWSYGEEEDTHLQEGWDLAAIYLRYPITFWTRTHWRQCFQLIR